MAARGDGMSGVTLYSPAYKSGAMWYVSALADGLAGAGMQVRLIAPPYEPREREPRHPGIRREMLPGQTGTTNRALRALRSAGRIAATFPRFLSARRHGREYLVTFYDWLPVQVAQFLWIKAVGGRLTYIVHDVMPHAWGFPGPLQWLERGMLRLSYRLPDRVVVLTQGARRQMEERWGRGDNVRVLPHGAFAEGEPSPPPGNRRLLIFGSLRRNKRILPAIQAMRLLKGGIEGLHLTIAGAPHQEDLAYWQECAEAMRGLEDVIATDIGFVPEERLHRLIAESDAVLLPYEDFDSASAVAILGAFSKRLLIATAAGGIGELIAGGLEPVEIAMPVTAEGIADAVRRFHALPVEEVRAMAARSRAALVELLSWDRIGRACAAMIGG
jgi:glycogen(starch) synthase